MNQIDEPLLPASVRVAEHARDRSESFSPPVVVDGLRTRKGEVFVAREDLLAGGTKQRAAIPFIAQQMARGHREFVYASPFAGFAQVALAVACEALGARCILFCERDPLTQQLHAFSRIARQHGATVILMPNLHAAEAAASEHCSAGALQIPLGLDCPDYRLMFERELRRLWPAVCRDIGGEPPRIWVSLGSGTLATVLRAVVGPGVRLRCIDVGVLPASDHRIARVQKLPNTVVERMNLPFSERASVLPLIPSNVHYDAKVWRFVAQEAGPRDLWWNVAR